MKQDVISYVANALQYALTIAQTNEKAQFISLCLSIGCSLVILIPKLIKLTKKVILKLKDWYKRSMKDGKVSKEELKEGVDIVGDAVEELKDVIEDVKNDKER